MHRASEKNTVWNSTNNVGTSGVNSLECTL